MGHKRPLLRPRCIWPGRAPTLLLLFYSVLSPIRLRIPIIRLQVHLFSTQHSHALDQSFPSACYAYTNQCKLCTAVHFLPIWNFVACSWFNLKLVKRKAIILYSPTFTYSISGAGICLSLDVYISICLWHFRRFVCWESHRSD